MSNQLGNWLISIKIGNQLICNQMTYKLIIFDFVIELYLTCIWIGNWLNII